MHYLHLQHHFHCCHHHDHHNFSFKLCVDPKRWFEARALIFSIFRLTNLLIMSNFKGGYHKMCLFFIGPVGHNTWWANSRNGSFRPKIGPKVPKKWANFAILDHFFVRSTSFDYFPPYIPYIMPNGKRENILRHPPFKPEVGIPREEQYRVKLHPHQGPAPNSNL